MKKEANDPIQNLLIELYPSVDNSDILRKTAAVFDQMPVDVLGFLTQEMTEKSARAFEGLKQAEVSCPGGKIRSKGKGRGLGVGGGKGPIGIPDYKPGIFGKVSDENKKALEGLVRSGKLKGKKWDALRKKMASNKIEGHLFPQAKTELPADKGSRAAELLKEIQVGPLYGAKKDKPKEKESANLPGLGSMLSGRTRAEMDVDLLRKARSGSSESSKTLADRIQKNLVFGLLRGGKAKELAKGYQQADPKVVQKVHKILSRGQGLYGMVSPGVVGSAVEKKSSVVSPEATAMARIIKTALDARETVPEDMIETVIKTAASRISDVGKVAADEDLPTRGDLIARRGLKGLGLGAGIGTGLGALGGALVGTKGKRLQDAALGAIMGAQAGLSTGGLIGLLSGAVGKAKESSKIPAQFLSKIKKPGKDLLKKTTSYEAGQKMGFSVGAGQKTMNQLRKAFAGRQAKSIASGRLQGGSSTISGLLRKAIGKGKGQQAARAAGKVPGMSKGFGTAAIGGGKFNP